MTATDEPAGGRDRAVAVAALAMARRFAAGATLWALAPAWPEHARHVAVEFVHPVIMGKRALPAVAVEADAGGVVDRLRSMVRSGDIVLAIGSADEAVVAGVIRRAPAWGALTVWLGAGPGPAAADADHVLWFPEAGPLVRHDGSLVFGYHVLWELVHVCFEHSALLSRSSDAGGTCITCRDEGRLGEVVSVHADGRSSVRTADGVELVETMMVDPVERGDLVLLHAGTAITKVAAE